MHRRKAENNDRGHHANRADSLASCTTRVWLDDHSCASAEGQFGGGGQDHKHRGNIYLRLHHSLICLEHCPRSLSA